MRRTYVIGHLVLTLLVAPFTSQAIEFFFGTNPHQVVPLLEVYPITLPFSIAFSLYRTDYLIFLEIITFPLVIGGLYIISNAWIFSLDYYWHLHTQLINDSPVCLNPQASVTLSLAIKYQVNTAFRRQIHRSICGNADLAIWRKWTRKRCFT